jgi:predicted ribosome quality control (RQC) complex YloA/Tae2 family protein
VFADIGRGRILVMRFHRASTEVEVALPEIEVRLFPRGANFIVRDSERGVEKSVAEFKPKDLLPTQAPQGETPARSWDEIEKAWRASQEKKTVAGAPPNEKEKLEREWRKTIEKKEKALERMREELAAKESPVHRRLGEWLKAHTNLVDVPAEFRDWVDLEKSLSWNIEESFRRAKENERKAEGTRARIEMVANELQQLWARGPRASKPSNQPPPSQFLAKADARGRRLNVGENLEAYIGKSAADNLALLRKAQPFDYWLHLRDMPGSHAILRRPRGRNVTDAEFAEAGRWVVEQSTGKRARELQGERYDLLIVECRYVRPIKGDKLGRVNYTHDRVMSLRF